MNHLAENALGEHGRGMAVVVGLAFAALSVLTMGDAYADPLDHLIERLDRIEEENRLLRKELEALRAERTERAENPPPAAPTHENGSSGLVRGNARYAYEIFDPTNNINRKQRLILERRKDGTLAPDSVHLQGAVTAVANFQESNRNDKFGYLMRHPTARNQIGGTVSEAAIHSVQLGVTGTLGDWFVGHAEMLFDPEQSFGAGTNTDLERNQVQVRRAYALLGDLDRIPVYASLGKMAVPFGLTDTVNPFSGSTVWHAFGALANGATLGYAGERLNLTAMGVQGGAQFRAANAPVEETAVPGRLNNFAADVSYSLETDSLGTLLLGASYLHGTAFCQDFPIVHFDPCRNNNPAIDVYGRYVLDDFTLKGEFARTMEAWPATLNPALPQFPASRVTAFDIGVRSRYDDAARGPIDFSAEFSRFVAGADGAPWERQDQIVLGAAWFARPSVKLFAEYIRTEGYAPLNFISGGNIRDESGEIIPNRTHSDRSAHSNVLMLGANLAF